MFKRLIFFFSLFLSIFYINAKVKVKILNGVIQGTEMKTRNGRSISAFIGIPYAKPPIGKLRFKDPEPITKAWTKVLIVEKDAERCLQKIDNKIIGNEDCLFLNVYTPITDLKKEKKHILLPVMVWIHGGGFVEGSSDSKMYGPEYLLDQNVLLVSMNYRLGIFGFFSTGDSASSGNFGLKDQVLALKWVNENIEIFGGDPNRVTIFGSEAGSASVNFHALSKTTDGLFQQYILHSGNAFTPWAYEDSKTFKSAVQKVAENMNCKNKNSVDLIVCLQNKKSSEIASKNFVKDGILNFSKFHWKPTNETDSLKNAYLTESPWKLMENNKIKDFPFIIGNVFDEGTIFSLNFFSNSTNLIEIIKTVEKFINHIATFYSIPKKVKEFRQAINNNYFNNSLSSMKKNKVLEIYTKLISDSYFLYPTVKFLQNVSPNVVNSFYVYFFGYKGKLNIAKLNKNISNKIGNYHRDELLYLFPMANNKSIDKDDELLINIMVDLWTSFAVNGKPTSEAVDDPDFWEPYTQNSGYLEITNDPDLSVTLEHDFTFDRIDFWKKMISQP